MYEMIFGHTPFRNSPDKPSYVKVLQDDVEFPEKNPLSAAACDFILQLLQKIPYRRLGHHGADEVRSHSFFYEHAGFDPVDWTELECQSLPAPRVPDLKHNADLKYFPTPEETFDETQYRTLKYPPERYFWTDRF